MKPIKSVRSFNFDQSDLDWTNASESLGIGIQGAAKPLETTITTMVRSEQH